MSRTKRKDPLHVARKRPDFVTILGETAKLAPTDAELAVAARDGKPSSKPGRKAKRYLHKGRKAKVRTALSRVVADPDAAPLPVSRRTDVWDYN